MKITFYSNFLNHHQLPFCLSMYEKLGDDFKFVATEKVPKERLDLGYHDMNKEYPFVITTYDSNENKQIAECMSIDSDVIIIGSAPEKYAIERLKRNKLTFRYSERIFKRGRWRILDPRVWISLYNVHVKYRNKNLYMLCASGYTASDFAIIGAYKNKAYKWGYFPQVIDYDLEKLFDKKKNHTLQILWCARFMKWKHPEKVIEVAIKLNKENYNYKINMIGIGELEGEIAKLVKDNSLEERVSLLGSMAPEKVREYMENANIFLFTSDYNEGWGAVLNESMNSGCAVLASHAIGSVPFLLKHEQNGLIYKNGDISDLHLQVKRLLDDENLQVKLGEQAYNTLNTTWNARNAVDSFLKLVDCIINNKENTILEGPCSNADVIPQEKMYKHLI